MHAGYLADLVAARQLFAFHMPDMCVANSTSATLFDTIAEAARSKGSLLSVMGYFPQQEVLSFPLASTTVFHHGSSWHSFPVVACCSQGLSFR